ncbi:hypothetical protein [Caulobacter sp. RL271]|uniref:Lipoprotein n=1 Tax=Caulobacter segnis TaxID=88688 RepID=A0ABY4ZXP8_9CAUL|nr:hypothetical protein [Caulobacter segnis]USQ97285.1 hypothetical protein MZV50_07000 [Caulobacter segnis]
MGKRIIIGLPGYLTAAAMLAAASCTDGMFVKPADLGGSVMPKLPRRAPDPAIVNRRGKLQKSRGRL